MYIIIKIYIYVYVNLKKYLKNIMKKILKFMCVTSFSVTNQKVSRTGVCDL